MGSLAADCKRAKSVDLQPASVSLKRPGLRFRARATRVRHARRNVPDAGSIVGKHQKDVVDSIALAAGYLCHASIDNNEA